jgi:hypothetical protein
VSLLQTGASTGNLALRRRERNQDDSPKSGLTASNGTPRKSLSRSWNAMSKRKISIKTFIRNHRADIDSTIRSICPNVGSLNDSDREDWVLNDEGLYNWARSEGVDI